MALTDASGQDMNIIGLAKITINTQSSPDVTAEIMCIVTDSVSSEEILIGPLDQKRLLLLHEDYPNQKVQESPCEHGCRKVSCAPVSREVVEANFLKRFAKEAMIRTERRAQRSFEKEKREELDLPDVKESLGRLPEKIREVILEYPTVFRRKLLAYSTLKMEPAKIILKEGKEEEGYHCGGCRKTPLHK